MPQSDMTPSTLRTYAPDLVAPSDLRTYWDATLAEARTYPLDVTLTPHDSGLSVLSTFDVTFAGYGGAPIKGWLHRPAGAVGPLPCVVEFAGYGGGRGLAHERVMWAMAGYAHLFMDTRGQGSTWIIGDTPDPEASGAPAHPGFMTRGILDPATYYYRRVFTDAVRAVDVALSLDDIDSSRIAVAGGSQGGAIAIAAASLAPQVAATVTDVPFLSDFPRAITIVDKDPYTEITRYLKTHRDHVEQVLRTLSYVDVAILGRWATAPAIFSVGLMDEITPPSTVYAAFNAYGGPKEIREYPFNDHEGGQGFHDVAKFAWLRERFSR